MIRHVVDGKDVDIAGLVVPMRRARKAYKAMEGVNHEESCKSNYGNGDPGNYRDRLDAGQRFDAAG